MRTFWVDFTALALLALAVMIPTSGVALGALGEIFDREVREDMIVRATFAALLLDAGRPDDQVMAQAARVAGARFTLIRADGSVAADSMEDPPRMENHARRPEVREALAGRLGRDMRVSATLGERWLYVAVPVPGRKDDAPERVVRAAVSLAALDARMAHWRQMLLGAALTAAGAALAGAWVLARRLSRPLEAVARGAERFAAGDLSHRVAETGTREFRSVARSLNRMAGELDARLEQIERRRQELDAILGGMAEGVVALSDIDEVLNVNPAGARMIALDPVAALGRPFAAACRHAELLDFLDDASRGGAAEREIHFPAARDGSGAWFFARITAVPATARTAARRILVLRDITRLKRLERVRSDFVHNVSHELRTPATSAQGYLELLASGSTAETERAAFLDAALRNARRLGRIIADLLLLADVENEGRDIPRETRRLRPLLEDALASARAAERDATVVLDCPEALTADVNAPLLEQAVANLVDNAIKYGPAGGVVTVAARGLPGDGAEIAVADAGEGIAPQHLSRLFERFYRVDVARSRETGGTGLGLALVRHIVLAHGGKVSAESEPGRGSCFRIRLDREPPPEP